MLYAELASPRPYLSSSPKPPDECHDSQVAHVTLIFVVPKVRVRAMVIHGAEEVGLRPRIVPQPNPRDMLEAHFLKALFTRMEFSNGLWLIDNSEFSNECILVDISEFSNGHGLHNTSVAVNTTSSSSQSQNTMTTTTIIDINHPYFLSSSDHPGLSLVSELLTDHNYHHWSRLVKIALYAKLKLGFIDGTRVQPPATSENFSLWMRSNDLEYQRESVSSVPLLSENAVMNVRIDHVKDKCFALHGYPDWHRLYGHPKPKIIVNSNKQATTAHNVTHSGNESQFNIVIAANISDNHDTSTTQSLDAPDTFFTASPTSDPTLSTIITLSFGPLAISKPTRSKQMPHRFKDYTGLSSTAQTNLFTTSSGISSGLQIKTMFDCTWLFRIKYQPNGAIERYKARPVTKGTNSTIIQQIIAFLGSKFKVKDLGPLRYFLGIKVVRPSSGIYIHRHKYTLDILAYTGLLGAKPAVTPIEQNHSLQRNANALLPEHDIALYHRLIGRPIYLTVTRPDIFYAVQVMSQFLISPKYDHLQAAYHII
ncbi:hypothetical protein AgCh_006541 [Apium graveolens]